MGATMCRLAALCVFGTHSAIGLRGKQETLVLGRWEVERMGPCDELSLYPFRKPNLFFSPLRPFRNKRLAKHESPVVVVRRHLLLGIGPTGH